MKKLSDCRVLLVDDAKPNLDILVEGLKSDHKLSLALNGEMALQIASRTPPDLVLLDIVMPGLDGYEVCRRLRGALGPTAKLVAHTAYAQGDAPERAREAGFDHLMAKPSEPADLLRLLGA